MAAYVHALMKHPHNMDGAANDPIENQMMPVTQAAVARKILEASLGRFSLPTINLSNAAANEAA